MALAPFFERVYGAIGGHLGISKDSLNQVLEGITVGISCGRRPKPNDIWIAELATNLLARLYPRMSIAGPHALSERLRSIALTINPQIEFVKNSQDPMTICCGTAITPGAIFAAASGWVAKTGDQPFSDATPTNPYSAGAAAALAAAQLFRRVFLKQSVEPSVSVSLLNFDAITGSELEIGNMNVGSVLFVGVGAVGNGALWAMSRDAKTKGRLRLLDPEAVELSNLQRYVLASYADIGVAKIELARHALAKTKFAVESYRSSLEGFADSENYRETPTTVISVDNVDGRRSAQALLPRTIINGWTGEHALGASWHVFSRESACLACLYHPRGQSPSAVDQAAKAFGLSPDRTALLWITHQPLSESDLDSAANTLGVSPRVLRAWRGKSLGDLYTDVVCGAVPLDVTGVGKVETVPLAHQSALAGILMAAELLKRTSRKLASLSQTEPLVTWDNILQVPPTHWRRPRAREPGCICGDADYQLVYKQKWNQGRKSVPS
jgi:hypothetical protein